jgi:hypothetical protein
MEILFAHRGTRQTSISSMGWSEARGLRPPGPAPRPRERKVCENSPELASKLPRDGDTGDWSLGEIELAPLAGRGFAEETSAGRAIRRSAQSWAGRPAKIKKEPTFGLPPTSPSPTPLTAAWAALSRRTSAPSPTRRMARVRRPHSSGIPALRRPSSMWAWSSGRCQGTSLRTYRSNEAGEVAIAFSSAPLASTVRPS